MHDRYPMGRFVSSFYFCSNTHPTCSSPTFVTNVICPVDFGKSSTDDETSASFSALIAANSASFFGSNFVS